MEVTVTGNRGWVDETTKEIAADMRVVPKIWFAPGFLDKWPVNLIFNHFLTLSILCNLCVFFAVVEKLLKFQFR